MAVMANAAPAVPGFHATAMILATTFVNTVTCSGFQHSVAAAPGRMKVGHALSMNHTAGCFNTATFPRAGSDNSTLVPWTALESESDPESELAVFYTFSNPCKKISATILTRAIPVSCPIA